MPTTFRMRPTLKCQTALVGGWGLRTSCIVWSQHSPIKYSVGWGAYSIQQWPGQPGQQVQMWVNHDKRSKPALWRSSSKWTNQQQQMCQRSITANTANNWMRHEIFYWALVANGLKVGVNWCDYFLPFWWHHFLVTSLFIDIIYVLWKIL